MVFGHRGHPGQHVAKHVEEDHQQDQDLALVRHVVEILALEAALKTNVVMRDVAVSIYNSYWSFQEKIISGVDGIWSSWSSWSECSKSCGGGTSKRRRSCSEESCGGLSCPGHHMGYKVCNEQCCGELNIMKLPIYIGGI